MTTGSIDYGTHKIATHTFTEDAETRDIERVTVGAGVVGDWGDTADVTATGLVSGLEIVTTGKGRIIIGATCNTTVGYFYTFRLVFKNSLGAVIGVSAAVSPKFGAHNDGTNKYAELAVFANDCGASSVGVYVDALPVSASTMTLNMATI